MRAIVVSPYFPPQLAAASLRVLSFARALAADGADVTVLTTQKRADQRGLDADLTPFRVLEVPFRVPSPLERLRAGGRDPGVAVGGGAPERPGGLRGLAARAREGTGVFASVRMPDLTGWWVGPAVRAAREAAGGRAWDVAVSSSGPYTAHLAAGRLKRAGLVRVWLADFRDLWTANHVFRGVWPLTVLERRLERRVLAAADAVTTVSGPLADWLGDRTTAPVEVVFNGHDRAEPPGADGDGGEDDAVRVLYCGALYTPRPGTGQDPGPFVRALAEVNRDAASRPVRLVVAGSSGGARKATAAAAGAVGLVEPLGVLARDELLPLQDRAHALLGLEWSPASAGVLTGKLPEYLASRPPVLIVGGGGGGPMAELTRRAGRGVHAGDTPGEIAATLRAVRDGRPLGGPADRGFVAGLHRAAQAERVVEIARRLAGAGGRGAGG